MNKFDLQFPSGRSAADLPNLDANASMQEIITAYNALVKQYNYINKALAFENNFDGYLAKVELRFDNSVRPENYHQKIQPCRRHYQN